VPTRVWQARLRVGTAYGLCPPYDVYGRAPAVSK